MHHTCKYASQTGHEPIKISVVIPCYNASSFIMRTLEALESQTYKNFEVIIVDDGCTDDTPLLLEKWGKHHDNYTVYSFENAGLSEARNRGMLYATGDYVYFLDADDWFVPTLFEEMVNLILDNDFPDAVRCGYKWTYCDVSEIEISDEKGTTNVYENKEIPQIRNL